MAPRQRCPEGRFVLEAKTGPNEWEPVEHFYPGGEYIGPFVHEGAARLAKASLKNRLNGKWKGRYPKHPIRVREVVGEPNEKTILVHLARAVADLDDPGVDAGTDMAMQLGIPAQEIMTRGIFTGLEQIGEMVESGGYFLKELGRCADMVNRARRRLVRDHSPLPWSERPVVLGTIQGDVHGGGKDTVISLLRAVGCVCVDLGQDVDLEEFPRSAVDENAGLVCISCSLDTAVTGVAWAVARLGQVMGPHRVPVMVGGGALTADIARAVGADGYGANAASAVPMAVSLMVGPSPLGREPTWEEVVHIGRGA